VVTLLNAWLSCFVITAAPLPTEKLVIEPAQRVEVVMTFQVKAPKIKVTEWVFLVPYPPELPAQTRVAAVLEPKGEKVLEASSLRRPVLLLRLPVKDKKYEHGITIRAKYQATLMSRSLVSVKDRRKAAPIPRLTTAERQNALAAVSLCDFKSKVFQKYLDANKLRRGQGETDLQFARRAFQILRKGFTYRHKEDQDRHASALCQAGWSDCAGHSVMLVTVLRANGIPARALVASDHVPTEFYANGIGWVPADLTFNRFGEDNGSCLILHIDFDLVVDLKERGRQTVLGLQAPRFWVKGKGSTEGSTVGIDWNTRELP
jgi:transglutaminase-like putative cysteine protease